MRVLVLYERINYFFSITVRHRGADNYRYNRWIMKYKENTAFGKLETLANMIQNGGNRECEAYILDLLESQLFQGIHWQRDLQKLYETIKDYSPRFAIIKKDGNSKLPFYCFSSLPSVTCPGAGECIKYCYSFKSWRYPSAFCRQAQNAWLLRVNPAIIAEAFDAIPANATFRLYVDGDFSCLQDVSFWMSCLKNRPDIKAYGYSKSFKQLLEYYEKNVFPDNYLLNISGGHNSPNVIVDKIKALPITRGTFEAINIGFKIKADDYGSKRVNNALRANSIGKVFPCPGKCGKCTPKGHACGLESFKGISIVIGVH